MIDTEVHSMAPVQSGAAVMKLVRAIQRVAWSVGGNH